MTKPEERDGTSESVFRKKIQWEQMARKCKLSLGRRQESSVFMCLTHLRVLRRLHALKARGERMD